MVTPDNRADPPKGLERRAQVVADLGMLLHQRELVGRQRTWLQQNTVGNPTLPRS